MKNNKLDSVTMSGSRRKREFFNLSCDNTTTFGFGEIQPTYVHPMLSDSKLVLGSETLVRLAPLNVPTFGRMSLKTYSQFVPLTDIYPCINELLAKTRYTYYNTSYVPKYVPHITLGMLSAMCLVGADVQIWVRTSGGSTSEQWLCPTQAKFNSDYASAFASAFGATWYNNNTTWTDRWFVSNSTPSLSLPIVLGDRLINAGQINGDIPIGNINVQQFFLDTTLQEPRVSMNTCDLFIEHTVTYNGNEYTFGIACNLSGFGKRIRKMLVGSGYQINVNSLQKVSLLPLFASWKAYFDLFNLPQWMNFEDTFLKKLITAYLQNQIQNPTDPSRSEWKLFTQFVTDLGSCWYTAAQDFVSAHSQNTKNGGVPFDLGSFIDVSNNANDATSMSAQNKVYQPQLFANDDNKDPDAKVTQTVHGQLDCELLKRLYKWTNRNSVIGQRVAELLKAQGQQDFVDSCKSNYIGSFDIPLRISDVVSQSDTYQNATDGKLLGEYGAKGLGYNKTERPLEYETKELGYWVTLATVVPDCGYAQSLDPSVMSIHKESFYNPEFDALGSEANPKLLVCAQEDITVPFSEENARGNLDETFGFVPTYSRLKVINNKLNGDIPLRSMRSYYPAYTLDKLIYLNDKEAGSGTYSASLGYVQNQTVFDFGPKQLPLAGNIWRFPTRYGWIGNLNRIFAAVGVNDANPMAISTTLLDELRRPSNDNFIAQTVFNGRYFAPMLRIEDSFETHDDGNEGKTTMAVNKA